MGFFLTPNSPLENLGTNARNKASDWRAESDQVTSAGTSRNPSSSGSDRVTVGQIKFSSERVKVHEAAARPIKGRHEALSL